MGVTALKKVASIDFSFKWIVEVCEKRKRCQGSRSSIQVYDQIILVNMGKMVGIAKKGDTKGLISKMSNMGIKGLVSLIRGDVVLFFAVSGFVLEVDGCTLNMTESYFLSVIMNVLKHIGTTDSSAMIGFLFPISGTPKSHIFGTPSSVQPWRRCTWPSA